MAPTPASGITPAVNSMPPNVVPIPAPVVEESQSCMEEPPVEQQSLENSYQEDSQAEPEVAEISQEINSVSLNEPKTYATLLKSGGNTSAGYNMVNAAGPALPSKTLSPVSFYDFVIRNFGMFILNWL